MEYLRVKKEADSIRIERPKKHWFLVANELITRKQAEKRRLYA